MPAFPLQQKIMKTSEPFRHSRDANTLMLCERFYQPGSFILFLRRSSELSSINVRDRDTESHTINPVNSNMLYHSNLPWPRIGDEMMHMICAGIKIESVLALTGMHRHWREYAYAVVILAPTWLGAGNSVSGSIVDWKAPTECNPNRLSLPVSSSHLKQLPQVCSFSFASKGRNYIISRTSSL